MGRLLFCFVSCTMILMLSGCLLPQEQLKFQADIHSLDQRVRNIERRPQQKMAPVATSGQLNNIGRQQANLKAELDSLRVDLQSLTGRCADQQHAMTQLREEMNLAQNDLSLKVAALESKLAVPASVTPPAAAPQVSPSAAVTPVPATPTAPTGLVPVAAVSSTGSTNAAATALYKQALQQVQQQGNFSQARTLFKQFIQKYPANSLAVNAMYWIGETYYGDKKYESAILQLQDVIQKYPDHPKVPAALMKQGLAFYALGDAANARVILQKVIDKYPQTPEAEKSKHRLATWSTEMAAQKIRPPAL